MEPCLQFEANVDDMDPRLWPEVIDSLISAGADDAWITPIIMKKGRPAFTISAMCRADAAHAVRACIFRETTTIGVREFSAVKHILDRTERTVDVAGQTIGVKTATIEGDVVNESVEWADVVAAARAGGLSAKQVLAAATAAAAGSRPDGLA